MSIIDDLIKTRMDGFSHGEALPHHAPHKHHQKIMGNHHMHPAAIEYRASFVFSPPLTPNEETRVATHLSNIFDKAGAGNVPRATITLCDPEKPEDAPPTGTLLVFGFPCTAVEKVQKTVETMHQKYMLHHQIEQMKENIRKLLRARQLAAALN